MKLPILETISDAYSLLGTGFNTLLRLTWFPYVLLSIIIAIINLISPGGSSPFYLVFKLVDIGATVLFGAVLIGVVMRLLLLKQPAPDTLFYFYFGDLEWQIFKGSVIIWSIFLVGIAAPSFLIEAPVSLLGLGKGVIAVLTFIAVGICLWVFLKLSMMAPMIVEEGVFHLGILRKSWHLLTGHTWRFLIVVLAVDLPFVFVVSLVGEILIGAFLGDNGQQESGAVLHLFVDFLITLFGLLPAIATQLAIFVSYMKLRGFQNEEDGDSQLPT